MQPAVAWETGLREQVADLIGGFTIETTPGAAAKIGDFREHLRPGAIVYVTFLPGSNFEDTIALARRLRREGFEPVPHVAARSIPDVEYLDDSLRRLAGEAGVTRVLVIGGAVREPVGEFTCTPEVLETGLLDRHGIRSIGVAGHPEGSPDMSDEAIARALEWKNAFAQRTDAKLHIVTQFCFEARPIIEWDRRIRAAGNRLPIHIGIPGLATIKTLLAHARQCGIGPSIRFISRQAMNVAKLMTVSAPDRLLADLADYRAAEPACGIERVHVYPLGGLARSAAWSYAASEGRIEAAPDGRGFAVAGQ